MDSLLREVLSGKEGPLAGETITKISSVAGGCIHQAWRLELKNGTDFFCKTASLEAFPMLEFEKEGLKGLKKFADPTWLEVPHPIALEKTNNTAFLLMPWLNLSSGDQGSLGTGLALLHKKSSENNLGKFGWGSDGFIGSGPQPKGWGTQWGNFFVNLRLIPQIQIANQWGLEIEPIRPLLQFLISFLESHHPLPSLVHGDLWSGNSAINSDGRGILFDPAIWWADREVDLAMTRLFGGYSREFYESYSKIWPLGALAEKRIEVYNLYHLLNHANLFGGSYKNQCISTIKRLNDLLLS